MQNALSLTDKKHLFFLFALGAFFIWSCSDVQKRTKPENLLSKDKMVKIYTDMLMLDAVYRTNPKKFKTYDLKPTAHIYNKFDIDSLTLAQNMNYYNLDFETNSEIYNQVRENIENQKQIIDSINQIKDSLKQQEQQAQKVELKDSISSSKQNIKADKN